MLPNLVLHYLRAHLPCCRLSQWCQDLGLLKVDINSKDWGEEGNDHLGLFYVLSHHDACPIQQWGHIFLSHPSTVHVLVETVLAAFARFHSRWALAFLTPFLHNQCLHTPPGLPALLPPLVHLIFMSELVRNHSGLLPHLLYFQLAETDHSWAWRRCFLCINQLSWIPLLSIAMSHKG